MVLAPTSLSAGAIVSAQSETPAAGLPQTKYSSAYSRAFSGAVVGSTPLLTVVSSAEVLKSQATASVYMTRLVGSLRSPKLRKALISEITKAFGTLATKATVSIRRDRTLKLGDSALDIDLTIKTDNTAVDTGQLYVQEGSAIGYVLYASQEPGLNAGQAFALAKKVAAQLKAASGSPPANTKEPSVGGTLSLGQILNASPGTWTAPTPTFAYQWFRCSATGDACVAIPGATEPQYTVSTADEGVTVAVSIDATNPAGDTIVMSPSTGVIP